MDCADEIGRSGKGREASLEHGGRGVPGKGREKKGEEEGWRRRSPVRRMGAGTGEGRGELPLWDGGRGRLGCGEEGGNVGEGGEGRGGCMGAPKLEGAKGQERDGLWCGSVRRLGRVSVALCSWRGICKSFGELLYRCLGGSVKTEVILQIEASKLMSEFCIQCTRSARHDITSG